MISLAPSCVVPRLKPLLLAISVLSYLSVQADAQKPKASAIKASAILEQKCQVNLEDSTFSEVLRALRKAGNVSFVVDGEPSLQKTHFQVAGTVKQALEKLAATYDCAWKLEVSGIVLLQRHFSRPEELPQAPLIEMKQMADDIVAALRTVPVDTTPQNKFKPLNHFVSTLTQTQVTRLRNGQRLGQDSLFPMQLSLLEVAFATNAYGPPTFVWENLQGLFDAMPASSIQSRQQTLATPDKPAEFLLLHTAKSRTGTTILTPLEQFMFIEQNNGG
jgi:hypothetical protein